MLEAVRKLMKLFDGSFINSNLVLVLMKKGDICFRLEDVTNELELKCKIIAFLSRGAIKYNYYNEVKYRSYDEWSPNYMKERKNPKGIAANKQSKDKLLSAINIMLNTEFTSEEMEIIYQRLGNDINRQLTIDFINSGYDLKVLERKN